MKIEKINMKDFIALSDIISLLNMASGFLSIICSINHEFRIAAILMIIAIMFDSSDGWVARKINRQDELGFGKNIDSLSDIVSFGVAPAIFLYCCINTTPGIFQIIVILWNVNQFLLYKEKKIIPIFLMKMITYKTIPKKNLLIV